MGRFIDLTGMTFGRLTVLYKLNEKNKGQIMWHCRCSCDKKSELDVLGASLRRGNTKSCGCLHREMARERFKNQTKEQRAEMNKKYKTINNTVNLTDFPYGICYTNKGEEILFDKEDYEKIKNVCWYLNKEGYVYGRIRGENAKYVFMHRIVMDCPEGFDVDHKHGIKTDNRKSELRIVTTAQNEMNKGKRKDSSSGCKGVTWSKRTKKWCARISYNKKRYWLGTFDNFEEAVKIRQEAEREYYGEFAYDYGDDGNEKRI